MIDRFIILLLLSSFFGLEVNAQFTIVDGTPLDFYRAQQGREDSGRFLTESNIEGSPYLHEEFDSATLYSGSEKRYRGLVMRYNIYSDQIEFKNENDQLRVLTNPEIVRLIEMGEDTIVYRPYQMGGQSVDFGFFLVLEDGPVNLLVKKMMIIREAKLAGAYAEAEPARFVSKPDTYFLQSAGRPAHVIVGKKGLVELFPDKSKEVSNFIKKNKIKTSKPEDLIELVRYYNGL
jgi:hypothetical protein